MILAPLIIFFIKFADDLPRSIEMHLIINFLTKGVIEILSSIIELGGLNCSGGKIGNSTCIGCLYNAMNGRIYGNIGVGLLFYLLQGYAKT